MSNAVYARIRENPKFWELVKRRSKLAWTLSAIVLVLFYGVVLLVAFAPGVMGQRVSAGSTLTVGVAAGLFMFVFFWLLTALYVRKANTEYDAMTAEIVTEATKGESK